MTDKQIAKLDREMPDHLGCKCAVCGRQWRIWYDDEDQPKVRLQCACETGGESRTGAAWG